MWRKGTFVQLVDKREPFILLFSLIFVLVFTDFRERSRERKRESDIDVREKHPLAASHTGPRPGMKPTRSVCGLSRNGTCSLLVDKTTLQPTEAHWPGQEIDF